MAGQSVACNSRNFNRETGESGNRGKIEKLLLQDRGLVV
jgi:hypothetical protein